MELWALVIRTIITYFFVLLIMRLMGKREIGKLSVFDLVVSIMMAEIAVIVIENTDEPLYKGLVPIITLMIIQISFSFASLKSKAIRNLMDGKPSTIIENGEINEEEMKKQRYNLDDLLMQLRDKNIKNVADVEFAILEPSGKLSVFKKESKEFLTKEDLGIGNTGNQHFEYKGLPIPVVIEGRVQDQNLEIINQTRFWLKSELRKQGIKDYKEIYFASVDHKGKLFIDRRDRL